MTTLEANHSGAESRGKRLAPNNPVTMIRPIVRAILYLILIPPAGRAALGQDALPDARCPGPLRDLLNCSGELSRMGRTVNSEHALEVGVGPAFPVVPLAGERGVLPAADAPSISDAPSIPEAPLALSPGNGLVSATPCATDLCTPANEGICCAPSSSRFRRLLREAHRPPMTARQKLILAGRNTIDPFNILTILGSTAISVASDPDSVYGPGVKGFARNSGVVFTEGLTAEFFGTFLIPSLVHQDPHYHRLPNASIGRRMAHAVYQVVWTQSDTGRPMFNYATVVGTVADDAVNDLYVPGRRLGVGASAARILTAIATDPIDNYITEFVPDLARRVKFRVVFVQRIINQVALEEAKGASE